MYKRIFGELWNKKIIFFIYKLRRVKLEEELFDLNSDA